MLRTRYGINQLEAISYACIRFAPFLNRRMCDTAIL
jgi:hypothetical protein